MIKLRIIYEKNFFNLNNILFVILLLIIISLPFNENLTRRLVYSLVFGGILLLFLKRIKKEKIGFPLVKPLFILFSTFLISLFFSSNFYESQKFFFSVMINYFFIPVMCWMVIDKIQKLKFVFWIVIFSFLLVLMNSFYQYIYGFDFFRGYSVINEQGVSIDRALTASFGHYNQLGEFIGSILLGLYFFIILNKDKKMKLISLFLFILGLFILFFTYSRGSWMSFLSGLILINLYLVFLNKDKKYFIYLIATFFFFILILIVMGRVFPSILGRFRFLIKLYDAGRFSIYESVINTFIKHPLFGVGLNQLPKFIPEGVDAHNIWLKVLGDTGLVGFVGFLYFMIIYFKEIFYNIKKEIQKPYFYYIIFFSSIYIFTLLENITDANIIDGWDLGIYFWLILGILLKSVYL